MALDKPLPMQIGGTYYYTLSSYTPVTIEVTVLSVTDADVDFAFCSLIAEHEGDPNLVDDAWVREHFNGLRIDELRTALRQELEQAASEHAEEEKLLRCTDALVERLGQSVPNSVVDSYEQNLKFLTNEELQRSGSSIETLEKDELAGLLGSIHAQAQALAERDAALDAYANKKQLKVDDSELPGLLRVSDEDYKKLVDQVDNYSGMQYLRASALREKARRALVAECNCTYHHETAEEAAARVEVLQNLTKDEG